MKTFSHTFLQMSHSFIQQLLTIIKHIYISDIVLSKSGQDKKKQTPYPQEAQTPLRKRSIYASGCNEMQ